MASLQATRYVISTEMVLVKIQNAIAFTESAVGRNHHNGPSAFLTRHRRTWNNSILSLMSVEEIRSRVKSSQASSRQHCSYPQSVSPVLDTINCEPNKSDMHSCSGCPPSRFRKVSSPPLPVPSTWWGVGASLRRPAQSRRRPGGRGGPCGSPPPVAPRGACPCWATAPQGTGTLGSPAH